MASDAPQEINAGERFAFGANWAAFLSVISSERIEAAKAALGQLLRAESLVGKTFLDIGSGSGLSSLAAHRMGAKVTSFDYDPQSVGCTSELRRRYAPDASNWTLQAGSVLDPIFMDSLGEFDVVYSWGVLHHTGQMWNAIEQAICRVAPQGQLFIAIYNDQGALSRFWTRVKRIYCSGIAGRWAMMAVFIPYFAARHLARKLLSIRPESSLTLSRGMSVYYDWIDWLGGYPFEVAKVEQLLHFCQARGLTLENLTTTNRLGCNELVLRRAGDQA